MAGHPMLAQVKSETSTIEFSGRRFDVMLSYHEIPGQPGHAVGVKFSDATNSTDSSKKININGMLLGRAIGEKVVEMTRALKGVSFLGFYLLTDEVEKERGVLAVRAKTRVYSMQARAIHEQVKHKLPQLTQATVNGGVAWGMGELNFLSKPQFQLFVTEMGKSMEVINHAN